VFLFLFHILRIYFLRCTVPFSFSNVRLILYRNNFLNKGATSLCYLLLNTTSPLFGSARLGSLLGFFVSSAAHDSIVAMARRPRQTNANPTDAHEPKNATLLSLFIPDQVYTTRLSFRSFDNHRDKYLYDIELLRNCL
jgi:hypothetical protein